LYPVLATIPDVVPSLKVVPLGGFTRPIVTNSVDDELKPETENPLINWLAVLCGYAEAVGEFTLCEYAVRVNSKPTINNNTFLIITFGYQT
jgi:hypothetical protein